MTITHTRREYMATSIIPASSDYKLQWNFFNDTGSTRAQVLASVDSLISISGIRYGYFGVNARNALGLPNTGYFILLANSANYRIIVFFDSSGNRLRLLEKIDGTWASKWKYTSLTEMT